MHIKRFTFGTIESLRKSRGKASAEILNADKDTRVAWIKAALKHYRYKDLSREDKGVVRLYLQNSTGYSRAQIARHIAARTIARKSRVFIPNLRAPTKYESFAVATLAVLLLLSGSRDVNMNASVLKVLNAERSDFTRDDLHLAALKADDSRVAAIYTTYANADGEVVAYPLLASSSTTVAASDGRPLSETIVSWSLEDMLRRVAQRREDRLRALGNDDDGRTAIRPDVLISKEAFPAYPLPEGQHAAAPSVWDVPVGGKEGQILMIQNGKIVWHDFPYLDQIRNAPAHGGEGTRRAGGMRSGGGTNTNVVNNNTTNNSTTVVAEPSGWTDGAGVVYLTTITDMVGIGTNDPETALEVAGTISGSSLSVSGTISGASLYISGSVQGAGLADCDAAASKLIYDAATGTFSCAIDQTVGTGLDINTGDERYVNTSGDTMTGALTINVTGGSNGTVGLNVLNTISGAVVHAQKSLTTSGTLVFEGAASGSSLYIASSFQGAGLVDCDIAGTSKLLWDSATGRFSCGTDTDTDTNTTYTAGRGLTLNGTSFSTNDILTGALISFTSVNGTTVHANNALSTSGTLVFEGAASGSSLYIATSLQGAGLTDCDAAGQTLNWDASTGRFTCGTDADTDTNTTYTAGRGLTLNGTSFSTNDILTGALISFTTVNGTTVHANNTLSSSGTLVFEGAASGSSLYIATSLQGAGLTDCDAAGQTLNWDASTGRFTCGTDADTDTNTTYTAGRGLTLNGTSFSTNDILTGSLIRFTTVSGSTVYARNSLSTSGTLVFEGAASGSSLWVSTFAGAGLTDCDLSTNVIRWDAATNRFSCGTVSASSSVSTGSVLTIGDARYVRKAGDTMTGALAINISNGVQGTVGLNVINTISGAVIRAQKTLASSGTLVFEGAASGSSLYIATSLQGAGLVDCDIAGTSKLLWDASTGRFSCGTDQSGGGASAPEVGTLSFSGAVQRISDSRYVNTAGDTMTGQLVINVSGGNNGTVALNVLNTISGAIIRAQKTLASSGTLVWEGAASGASLWVSTLEGAGLTDCDAAGQTLNWDATTKRFVCGVDDSAGSGLDQNSADARYVNTSGDTMTGALTINVTGGSNGTVGLNVMNAISGAVIHAQKSLTTSGTLVFEGAASGSSLYIATSLQGAGLVDCDIAGTSKLLWDSATGRFSCGTDADTDTNTTYTAGRGLTLNGTSFSTNDILTGSLIRFSTVSGSTVYARNSLSTSGTLVFEGAASGSSLYVASSLNGAGLTDCDAASQVLKWDSATGRFSCGTATNNSFGTGNVLTLGDARYVNTAGDTMTGTLSINPASGLALNARGTISGSLITQNGAGSNYFMGNVGIGTVSPATQLDVQADGTTSGNAFIIRNSAGTKTFFVQDNGRIGVNTSASVTSLDIAIADDNTGISGGAGTLSFITNGSTDLTIIDSGNVGIGTTGPKAKLDVAGSMSGTVLTLSNMRTCTLKTSATGAVICGTDIDTDTNTTYTAGRGLTLNGTSFSTNDILTGSLIRFSTVSGSTVYARNSLSTSGSLTWEGAASGASLWVSTLEGAGLTDCDAAGQTLNWDATTKRFVCGVDDSAASGLDQNSGDARYVNVAGDTMTGALTINVTGGSNTTLGLNVLNTISGSIIRAQKTLASSGTLVTESGAYIDGNTLVVQAGNNRVGIGTATPGANLEVNGADARMRLVDTDASGQIGLNFHNSANEVAAMLVDTNTNTLTLESRMSGGGAVGGSITLLNTGNVGLDTATPGSRLSVSGSAIIGNNIGSGIAKAQLDVKGSMSGTVLTLSNMRSCTLKTSATGAVICGTDIDTNTTYTAGQGLSLAGTSFSLNSTITGALVRFNTVSGSLVYAKNTLASSGTLVWEGAASGSSLYIASSLQGAGLTDCDAASQFLKWDTSTGRFSCGTISASSSFGTGNVLTIGDSRYVRTAGGTMTGALTINVTGGSNGTVGLNVLNTISGAVIRAQKSLASSGSLVWEGAGSGSSLNLAGGNITVSRSGAVVINEAGNNVDFRIESDLNSAMFFMDASTNRIGINTSAPVAQLHMPGQTPTTVGTLNNALNGWNANLVMQGRYVYGGGYNSSFEIFDASVPASLVKTDSLSIGSGVNGVAVQGQLAYVTWGGSLSIVDISNPTTATLVQKVGVTNASNIAVDGHYAYVVRQSSSAIDVVDVSNPKNPTTVGTISTGTNPRDIAIQGDYLYVVNYGAASMQIIDVNNPTSPVVVGSVTTGTQPYSVQVQGRYAYVVNLSSGTMEVIDVSDVANPAVVGTVSSLTSPWDLAIRDRYAYVVGRTGTLYTIDISAPTAPATVYTTSTGYNELSGVAVQGRYLYVSGYINDDNGYLRAYDIGGSYMQSVEAGDIEAGALHVMQGIQTAGLSVQNSIDVGNNLYVAGNTAMSGSLKIMHGFTSGSGNIMFSRSGAVVFNEQSRDVDFRIEGDTDASLFYLDASTDRVGIGTNAPKAKLDVAGSMSGTVLTLSNMRSCTLKTSATGAVICGTDDTGGGGSFGTGNVVTVGDSRYVNTSGDTMTGALTINVTGGTNGTVGLNVLNTISGAVIRAQKSLASSGTLVWEGAGSGSSLYVSTLTTGGNNVTFSRSGAVVFNELAKNVDVRMEGATDPSLFFLDASTDRIGIGTVNPDAKLEVAGTISGSTLTILRGTSYLLGSVGIGTTSPKTKFEVIGSMSGASLVISRSTSLSNSGILISASGTTVFNDQGRNVDFRIEGDTNANLFTVDASTDRVGVGTVRPAAQFHVAGQAPLQADIASGSTVAEWQGDLDIQNNYVYGINTSNQIVTYDVSNPLTMSRVNLFSLGASAADIDVQGQYGYVVGSAGLHTLDLSNPAIPTKIQTSPLRAAGREVVVDGPYSYVAYNSSGISVMDISNPFNPVEVGFVATQSAPLDMKVQGDYLYVVNFGSASMQIIDINNPASPVVVGSVTTGTAPTAIDVQGAYAYVVNQTSGSMQVIDVKNVASPRVVGSVTGLTAARMISVRGRYVYVGSSDWLYTIDISTPTAPTTIHTTGVTFAMLNFTVQGRYVYAAIEPDEVGFLYSYDIGGAYVQSLEAGDTDVATLSVRQSLNTNGLNVQNGAAIGNNLFVAGNTSMSGALKIAHGFTSGSGNIMFSRSGAVVFNEQSRNVDFRIEGDTDASLFFLDASTDRVGIGTNAPKAKLDVAGSMSGTVLTLSNMRSCTLKTSATGAVICGTDNTGGGSSFGTGNVLTIGDSRYLRRSGGTMTGALTINVTGGNNSTIGLNVLNTISGAIIRAQKTLASSGTLVWEGAASGSSLYVATSIQGAGLTDCDAASSKLIWDASTGRFGCGTDQTAGGGGLDINGADARYVNVAGDTMTGALIIRSAISGSGALSVIQTTEFATGAYVYSSGTVLALDSYSLNGGNKHILFGYRGQFDTNLYRNGTGSLKTDGSLTWLGTGSGNRLSVGRVVSNLIPAVTNTYDLGSSALRWRDLYLSGGTLRIGAAGNEAQLKYNTSNQRFGLNISGKPTNELTIASGGLLGINTNNPTAALTVSGSTPEIRLGNSQYYARIAQTSNGFTMYNNISGSSTPYAIEVDGTADRVSIAGSTTYVNSNSAFSFAAWVWLDDYGNTYPLMATLKTNGSNGYDIGFSNSGGAYEGIWFGSSSTFTGFRTTGGTPSLNAWHHVVITYNGSGPTTAGNYTVYLDGSSQSLTTNSGHGPRDNTTNIGGGLASGSATLEWDGKIDDVRIYSSVLSSGDVSTMYASGAGSQEAVGTPVSWWKFDEGTGTTAADSGTAGATGTLQQNTAWVTGKAQNGAGGVNELELIGSVASAVTGEQGLLKLGDDDGGTRMQGKSLYFYTGGAERARFTSSGFLALGTTTAGSRLTVSGSVLINNLGNIGTGTADAGVALEIVGMMSGRTLRAGSMLASSGGLVFEGVGSGSSLTLAGGNISWSRSGSIVYNEFGNNVDVRMEGDTNQNLFFLDASADRIGIGKTAPKAMLDVFGTMSGNSLVVSRNSFFSGSGTIFTASGNTVFNEQSRNVDFRIEGDNAANLFFLDASTDRVGINTSLPRAQFAVNGTMSGTALSISRSAFFSGSGIIFSNTGAAVFNENGNNVDFRIEGDNVASLLVLDASADRIGVGTNAPKAMFDVAGTMSGNSLVVSRNAFFSGSGITFSSSGSAVFNEQSRNVDFRIEGDADGSLFFLDASSDRIGIGTSTPKAKFDVLGTISGSNVFASNGFASSGILVIESMGKTGSGAASFKGVEYQTGAYVYGSGAAALALETYSKSGALAPHILFGYRGSFDTKLTRVGTGSLRFESNTGVLMNLDTERTDATGNVFQIFSDAGSNENKVFRIQANGATFSDNAYASSGADYAEWFFSTDKLKAGEVVCIDVTRNNAVKRCGRNGDGNVMGIVSTNPAFVGNTITGADGIMPPGYYLVGLIGQVPTFVNDEGGDIRPGDALTASSIAGVARKATAGESTVGVALEGMNGAKGTINVLISRRNQSMTVEAVEDKVLKTIAAMEIEDEVEVMISGALGDLNVDEQISTEVTRQLAGMQSQQAMIAAIQNELNVLKTQLDELAANRLPSTVEGTQSTVSGAFVGGHLAASSAEIDGTLVTGSDARVGGDLTVDGSLTASSLFVPNGMNIQGGIVMQGLLDTTELRVAQNAIVDGAMTINGSLTLGSGAYLDFGSGALSIGDLIVHNSLFVMGDITIEGLATFLGDLEIKGELIVSDKHAGYAMIPAGGTGVTVHFGSGYTQTPIVTATPNGRVDSAWWLSVATQTGFSINVAEPVAQDTLFSWIALSTGNPITTLVLKNAEDEIVFPLDTNNVPVSSSAEWNACIRNIPMMDENGQPMSCARYHDAYTWTHPDLNISFVWNTSMTPAFLKVPDGYVPTVTENAQNVEDGIDPELEEVIEDAVDTGTGAVIVEPETETGTTVIEEESSSSAAASSEATSSAPAEEVIEEPVVDTPVEETPVEEPVAEEPVVEEPIVEPSTETAGE